MSIKAIFYSKFDPHQGPKIVHQVPEDSILTSTELSSSSTSLPTQNQSTNAIASFSDISRYLIPRQSLCGNLMTINPPPLTPSSPTVLVLSFPQCITSSHYPRNEFMFNFSIALPLAVPTTTNPTPEEVDVPAYRSILTKFCSLMLTLEETSFFLSSDTSAPNSGPIYSLLDTFITDINNYAECMIPIDAFNTLNLKLFPTLSPPPRVEAWHVPLFTVRIETLIDENWDLTMQRIVPYIDGVNSVKRIAMLADADLKLTRKCVRHFCYYGCVLLLDIFSFNAIYAPTAEFGSLIARDLSMQRECARYVNTAFAPASEEAVVIDDRSSTSKAKDDENVWPLTAKGAVVDGVMIVQLFANLRQGLTIREWYLQNEGLLANVDVRRFVTFGVIKGFLYRVHRYAVRNGKGKRMVEENGRDGDGGRRKKVRDKRDLEQDEDGGKSLNVRISEYLDGPHCFDEICTDLEVSERELMDRLKSAKEFGEVLIICR